jgi:GTP cyclohydrolase II
MSSERNKAMTIQGEAMIPTDHGEFQLIAYSNTSEDKMPHLALFNPKTRIDSVVNVRIHSECLTGDLFGSNRCECGEQLDKSLEYIAKHTGLLIYLRQEGRGIGIINKLHAYEKQDAGYDTAEANQILGFTIDARQYDEALFILEDLKIKRINLLTNNPDKVAAFDSSTIEIVERIPLQIQPKKENRGYLETKKSKFGHHLDVI